MKTLIAILAFIMTCQAQAQQKTLIYDERTNQLVEVSPAVAAAPQAKPQAQAQAQGQAQAQAQSEATATAVAPSAPAASPIFILNNQRLQGYQGVTQGTSQGAQAQAAAIQQQPTTVVVDAPAKVSASDSIRKQRAETEAATEDGIVHALEKARLEDEVRRREKFNNALAPQAAAPVQQQAVIVAPAPVAVVPAPAQAPVVQQQVVSVPVVAVEVEEEAPQKPQKPQKRKKVVLEEAEEQVDVKAEIRAALAERDAKPVKPAAQYYVSGLIGMGNFADIDYVDSALATGFTVGMVTSDRFVIEGSFAYGDYTLGNNGYWGQPTISMDQYDFAVAGKYQILSGKIRPAAGVIASYSRRNYTSDWFYSYGYGDTGITTDTFNAGLTAGLDIALTQSFSLGVDFRYMWSIASRDNSNPYNNSFTATNNSNRNWTASMIEDSAFYMTSIAAKFTF